MLDKAEFANIRHLIDLDLAEFLPKRESSDFEYKSSKIKDDELKVEIQKAASAFWNSGGGYFVAGVDDQGSPDGGISRHIGRQPRREWVDRILSSVEPAYSTGYLVHEIQKSGSGLDIQEGNCVLLVAFASSENAPHQSPGDKRYYIRSGAHSDPAPAFIIEALFARRGRLRPLLRVQFRREPYRQFILEIGVINVGGAPAIDIELEFDKRPIHVNLNQSGKAIRRANIIDRENPLYFGYESQGGNGRDPNSGSIGPNRLTIRYKDALLNSYEDVQLIDSSNMVIASDDGAQDRSAKALESISRLLTQIKATRTP